MMTKGRTRDNGAERAGERGEVGLAIRIGLFCPVTVYDFSCAPCKIIKDWKL
jgi:hypothetical protein